MCSALGSARRVDSDWWFMAFPADDSMVSTPPQSDQPTPGEPDHDHYDVSRTTAMVAKLSRMPARVCTSPHTASARPPPDRSVLRVAMVHTLVKSLINE